MGSGLEAFTRLHHGVFLAGAGGGASSFGGGVALDDGPDGGGGGSEAELYALQLVSSELTWRERGCVVRLEADAPGPPPLDDLPSAPRDLARSRATWTAGDVPPGQALSARLSVLPAGAAEPDGAACALRVRLRVNAVAWRGLCAGARGGGS